MNLSRTMVAALAAAALVSICSAQSHSRPPEAPSWAPKPIALTKYVAPHKPVTRLADLKKLHAGEANWRQVVVDDDTLHGEYISPPPARKSRGVSIPIRASSGRWWKGS